MSDDYMKYDGRRPEPPYQPDDEIARLAAELRDLRAEMEQAREAIRLLRAAVLDKIAVPGANPAVLYAFDSILDLPAVRAALDGEKEG